MRRRNQRDLSLHTIMYRDEIQSAIQRTTRCLSGIQKSSEYIKEIVVLL